MRETEPPAQRAENSQAIILETGISGCAGYWRLQKALPTAIEPILHPGPYPLKPLLIVAGRAGSRRDTIRIPARWRPDGQPADQD
jgi:hypothetical protein